MSPKKNVHGAAAVVLGLGLVGAVAVAGTAGAASPLGQRPANVTKAEIAKTCTRVADVLSDGPDPGTDPVGYALAQVRPLRQVQTPDAALKRDIDNLASAFEAVYKSNDKKGTQAVVQRAGKQLDKICPGAF